MMHAADAYYADAAITPMVFTLFTPSPCRRHYIDYMHILPLLCHAAIAITTLILFRHAITITPAAAIYYFCQLPR